jgi:DNA-directed RNA polymerase subunit RPC12/RpoP
LYCVKCGTQLPDDSEFWSKCGTSLSRAGVANPSQPGSSPIGTVQVVAPSGATSLKCPSCGAPIGPKFGEMIITCEYCGSSITLGNSGWANIEKQTMLPLKIPSTEEITARVGSMMDRGLLNRHLQESSTLEEMTLSLVPYWLVAVSARTSHRRYGHGR